MEASVFFDLEESVIRTELAKVLASDTFARSDRLRRFLRFAVENHLGGNTGLIKEAVIGVEVFDRAPTYDPKSEPIVRIEARRLRDKLQQYYATEGSHDAAVINLPRGGYVPTFEPGPNQPIKLPLEVVLPVSDAPKARRYAPGWAWFAAFLLIAVAAAGFWVGRAPRTDPVLSIVPLTTSPGMEMHPSLSPDGKQVAFTWDGDGDNFDIYVKLLDSVGPLRLTTNPGHDLYPAWSPDGREIAFLRLTPEKQEILAVPALGGPERRLAELSPQGASWVSNPATLTSSVGPAWSPNGKSLLVVDRAGVGQPTSIYLVFLETDEKRRVTIPSGSQSDSGPQFSPDGKSIIFIRTSSTGAADVWLQNLGSVRASQLTFDQRDINRAVWSRDGGRIIFASSRSGPFKLWSVPVSGGPARPIDAAGNNALYPSISPAGLAFSEFVLNLNIWRVASSPAGNVSPVRLIASSRRNHSAQYSPDGKRIVFVSNRSGAEEIWIADADGGRPQRLTSFNGPVTGTPRWSPLGDRIVFDSRVQGHSAVFTIRPEGGNPFRLTPTSGDHSRPSWSHDGRWIYFNSKRGESTQIWKMPASGGDAVQLTRRGGVDPMESPDGRFLYYAKPSQELWMLPLDGGDEEPVAGMAPLGSSRCWAITQAGVYFIADQHPQTIQFFDFSSRQLATIAQVERRLSLSTPSLSVSPDGRWILYAQIDERGSDLSLLKNFR